MQNNSYTVAVLGAGNIGSAVISRLSNLDNEVIDISISKVLVSDVSGITHVLQYFILNSR